MIHGFVRGPSLSFGMTAETDVMSRTENAAEKQRKLGFEPVGSKGFEVLEALRPRQARRLSPGKIEYDSTEQKL
jgi:hypothetical protein